MPSTIYCPPDSLLEETQEGCRFSLRDIAAMQQSIANGANKGASSLLVQGQTIQQSQQLKKGKDSFDSNPLTPPWVQMPDGGFPFSSNGTIDLPVGGTGFQDVIGPNGQYVMQVPNGNDGVIKKIVNWFNGQGFVSGSGQLIWRILINGQAVRNYDNILVQLGVAPFPGETEGIRVKSGDTVQFQVSNVSLGSGGTQITCFLGGWYYPCKLS